MSSYTGKKPHGWKNPIKNKAPNDPFLESSVLTTDAKIDRPENVTMTAQEKDPVSEGGIGRAGANRQ